MDGFWVEATLDDLLRPVSLRNYDPYGNAMSGAHLKQAAMYDAAMAQHQYANYCSQASNGLMRYGRGTSPTIFGGLGQLGRMF